MAATSVPVIPAPGEVLLTDKPADPASLSNVRYVKTPKMGAEAYALKIRKRGITIRYATDAGRFYAEKTLGQLSRNGGLCQGIIRDEPRFAWRGFMLDEARHFQGKEKVKELLDIMAEFKLNRFHWHLTDNEGWRLEIKSFPELTAVGAIGNRSDRQAAAQYETQEDIREIVQFAADRHIEISPEIDMPGHSGAIIRSIPELDGKKGTLNPGSERTYVVIEAILREVAGLFPGRYIHIGGDEVNKSKWPELPEVQELMKREGYQSTQEVQHYFGRRVTAIVTSLGKKAMGWDDLRTSGISPDDAVLHWWQTRFYEEKFQDDLRRGFHVVACPNIPMYFDYIQEEGHIHGFRPDLHFISKLKDIYEYQVEDNPLVVGVQANLWSELVHNSKRMDFMIYPRLFALSELAWSKERDFPDFQRRLEDVYPWMDNKGLYYYDARHPERHPEPEYQKGR